MAWTGTVMMMMSRTMAVGRGRRRPVMMVAMAGTIGMAVRRVSA
jgi:hypothetical protein